MKGTLDLDYARQRQRRPDFRYRLKRRTEEVLRSIASYAPNPERVLDMGTAEGKMLSDIQQAYPAAFCVGIEYSLGLLHYGASRFRNIHLVCSDIQSLSLRSNETFDVIIATAVLEHLSAPLPFLEACRELLRKGGILILTVPHRFWERAASRVGLIGGDHQSHFKARHVLDLCQRAQLGILENRGFMLSPVGFWGERTIESLLSRAHLGTLLPNQLTVATKKMRPEGHRSDGPA